MNAPDMTFATALNCMDGRVQLPVHEAVCSMFGVSYVDTITEAGIVKFLSDDVNARQTEAVLSRIRISVDKHGSRAIAVAAHADCAGNPCGDERQKQQLRRAVGFLAEGFADCRIVGLWVGMDGSVETVASAPSGEPGQACHRPPSGASE